MQFENGDWVRTCQECGNEQKSQRPAQGVGPAYQNAKCKRCRSPGLDYGHLYQEPVESDDYWGD